MAGWWQLKWQSLNVLGQSDSQHRQAAIRTLGQLGDRRATATLLKALDDRDPRVRQESVEALAELRDPSAVGPLSRMLDDSEGDICQAAACALGCLGDARAAGPLIAALDTLLTKLRASTRAYPARSLDAAFAADGVIGRRARCAEVVAAALGELGVRDAVEPLCRMLGERCSGRDGRACAAWALGKLGDPGALDALCRALRDDRNDVRLAAAEALEKLGSTRAVEPLLEALRDTWSERATAETEYQRPRILLNVNDDAGWGKVREAVKTALVKLGDTKWKEVYQQAYAARADRVPRMVVCLFDPKETSAQCDGACAEARFLAALQEALTTSGGWGAVPSLVGCSGSLPREGAPGSPTGVVVLRRLVAGQAVDARLSPGFLTRLEADPASPGLVPYAVGMWPISAALAQKVHGALTTSRAPGYIGSVTLNAGSVPRELRPHLAAVRKTGLRGSAAVFAAAAAALGVPVKMGIKDSGRCFGWLVSELDLYKMGLVSFEP